MPNVFDYLDWRGDVPLSTDPFNEVDNLIFAKLAYVKLDGVVPAIGEPLPIPAVRDAFFEKHTREDVRKDPVPTARSALLLDPMADGARFAGTKLLFYVNELVPERTAQIAAVTFLLPDGAVYVAFRGTDNTLIGWKEDFEMSYVSRTHGQVCATEYLNAAAERTTGALRVGGHSKGGNFAVFASAFCRPEVRERIETIYCNDSPGMRKEIIESPGYAEIQNRIYSVVPESSVIGRLLFNNCTHRVIESTASGIYQHDGFSWQVRRNRFIKAQASEFSLFIDRTLDEWMDGMNDEERRVFTETLFSLFSATGLDTVQQISEKKLRSLEAIVSAVRDMPKEKQKELVRYLGELLQVSKDAAVSKIPKFGRPKKADGEQF